MPGGVSGSFVSSEKRHERQRREGKPEGSRNKRSVALASLIAVSPPAFEQEDSSDALGVGDAGSGAKGERDTRGEERRERSEGESRRRLAGRAAPHVRAYARVFMGILQESSETPIYNSRPGRPRAFLKSQASTLNSERVPRALVLEFYERRSRRAKLVPWN